MFGNAIAFKIYIFVYLFRTNEKFIARTLSTVIILSHFQITKKARSGEMAGCDANRKAGPGRLDCSKLWQKDDHSSSLINEIKLKGQNLNLQY